jgi:N,N'-diacetyllegionaminate synthase
MQNFFTNLSKCMIIAEIGVNHNGDLSLAKEMIDSAKSAGADAVKFQTFKAENLVSKGTPKVKYQQNTTSPEETHYEMIKKLELSRQNHHFIKEYCDQLGIEFLSTPYDLVSARFLNEELGVRLFKTASADLIDHPLHEYIASSGKPSIVSVGMATLDEIAKNISIYKNSGHEDLILLHCVSNYPCSDQSLNLRVMDTLRETFDFPVGYSDHSIGNEAAVLSITFGAKVIEKHFTLDKALPGPDHLASSTPEEFKQLVKSVRRAENMLGSSVKECQEEEKQMATVSRKSIVMNVDLKAGTRLGDKHLTIKRPGVGLKPEMLPTVLGRKLLVDKTKDDLLRLTDLK